MVGRYGMEVVMFGGEALCTNAALVSIISASLGVERLAESDRRDAV